MNTPDVWFPHIGVQLNHLSRVAITLFGFNVYWYGILLGSGAVAGLLIAMYQAKRFHYDPDIYVDFLFYAIIFSIVGSRLYYVVFSWSEYKDNLLKIFAIREGGLAIYGTIIGAILTAIVYTRVKKINLATFLDNAAPGLVIGQVIGRWGNFVNREAFGGYTDSILAMRYKVEQMGYIPKVVADKIVEFDGVKYIQVHPTFLYESLSNLCLFIFLMIYSKHKKYEGEVVVLYFLCYGIIRFFIEGLRTDQLILGTTGIPVSQLLSLILVVVMSGLCIFKRVKRKRTF